MSKSPIGEPLRRDLESALKTEEFRKAFEELKKRDAVFERYPTVEALVVVCEAGVTDTAGRDRALGWILRSLREGNALYPLVLMMFWKSLDRLFRRVSRVTSDPETLFERIQWEFYQTVMRLDPDRLPSKLAVNIFLNTRRGVIKQGMKEVRERRGLEQIKGLAGSGVPLTALAESATPPEELETLLVDLVQKGILKPVQGEIILETDVRRVATVAEWARQRGIPRRTAQSHRHRAFLALRQHLGLEGPEK